MTREEALGINITTRNSRYNCKDISLGESDIARLILDGRTAGGEPVLANLFLGEDGDYSAHMFADASAVPAHYTRIFSSWKSLRIYDDTRLTAHLDAAAPGGEIVVYRSGVRGIAISGAKIHRCGF